MASLTLGQTCDKIKKSHALNDNVSGSHNGIKLHQVNLLGSYDLFYPVCGRIPLFGGATAAPTGCAAYLTGETMLWRC